VVMSPIMTKNLWYGHTSSIICPPSLCQLFYNIIFLFTFLDHVWTCECYNHDQRKPWWSCQATTTKDASSRGLWSPSRAKALEEIVCATFIHMHDCKKGSVRRPSSEAQATTPATSYDRMRARLFDGCQKPSGSVCGARSIIFLASREAVSLPYSFHNLLVVGVFLVDGSPPVGVHESVSGCSTTEMLWSPLRNVHFIHRGYVSHDCLYDSPVINKSSTTKTNVMHPSNAGDIPKLNVTKASRNLSELDL
jgi:hypothetical protein